MTTTNGKRIIPSAFEGFADPFSNGFFIAMPKLLVEALIFGHEDLALIKFVSLVWARTFGEPDPDRPGARVEWYRPGSRADAAAACGIGHRLTFNRAEYYARLNGYVIGLEYEGRCFAYRPRMKGEQADLPSFIPSFARLKER